MTISIDDKTQQGYLVLADISGFTSYLAGVELDHAEEILSDLLELIVDKFRSLLTICKLEGDAVFAYAAGSTITRGETLLELLEATYTAFRNRITLIHRRTTCECRACRAIPSLDLKFITHYGSYIRQTVAGINDLVGSDVNLVHRLLKNHVAEATDWHAYALFTRASLEQLCLEPEGMHLQIEAYDHLGQVQTYSLDLRARYQAVVAARKVFLPCEEADVVLTARLNAPPAVSWSWLNDPARRSEWMEGATWSAALRPGGRTGVGARNHCAHGKSVSQEEIMDWRPFDYYTSELIPDPNSAVRLVMTFHLIPLPSGEIQLNVYVKAQIPSLPGWLSRTLCRIICRVYRMQKDYDQLARLLAVETRDQAAVDATAGFAVA